VIQDKVSMEELIGTLPRFFGATRPENGFGPSLN
jgi:hypothetical protein